MQNLSCFLLAAVWIVLYVQATPRGSPSVKAKRRRMGRGNGIIISTAAPTLSPTIKMMHRVTLAPTITVAQTENVHGERKTLSPTPPVYSGEWGATGVPTSPSSSAASKTAAPTAYDFFAAWGTTAPTGVTGEGETGTAVSSVPSYETEWETAAPTRADDFGATDQPSRSRFGAEWGAPTPTAHDKKTPWIDIGNNVDADDDDNDGVETVVPSLPIGTVSPSQGGTNDLPIGDDDGQSGTTAPTIPNAAPGGPDVITTSEPIEIATTSPSMMPSVAPVTSQSLFPSMSRTEIPLLSPGMAPVMLPQLSPLGFQPSGPLLSPAGLPVALPELSPVGFQPAATIPTLLTPTQLTPVEVSPINLDLLESIPTLTLTGTNPTPAPNAFMENTQTGPQLWTPLKTFDIRLSRDTQWNTQFAPEELQQGLESYLEESFMLLSAEVENVTLTLFTSAHNGDGSEAWYRFQGRLYYQPADDGSDINPDEVWAQQVALLNNRDAVQWIMQNQPTLAAGLVAVEDLTFLDGSSTQSFEGDTEADSGGLNMTTKIVIAVAAILLILAVSVGMYIMMFVDTAAPVTPLPVIQTKDTSNMESDVTIGKEPHSDNNIPEVTFEQESHSEMSSITELRQDQAKQNDSEVPDASSVDAIASNSPNNNILKVPLAARDMEASQLSSVDPYRETHDMESLQLSNIDPDWSIMAGHLDPDDQPISVLDATIERDVEEDSFLKKDEASVDDDSYSEKDQGLVEDSHLVGHERSTKEEQVLEQDEGGKEEGGEERSKQQGPLDDESEDQTEENDVQTKG